MSADAQGVSPPKRVCAHAAFMYPRRFVSRVEFKACTQHQLCRLLMSGYSTMPANYYITNYYIHKYYIFNLKEQTCMRK